MPDVMLRTEGLTKGFTLHLQGGLRLAVLAGIDLTVRAGECVALTGPSGVGKTTLLRSLYGTCRADGGRILIRHRGALLDLAAAEPRAIVAGHPILLLDEPTAALDAANRATVLALINEAKARGAAIVTILHDAAALAVADRAFPMTALQDAA